MYVVEWLVDCRQTWRHHFATFKRVMVSPAVCPRLFEFLTTLTFGQRGDRTVSKAFETIDKKITNTETRKAPYPHATSNLPSIP